MLELILVLFFIPNHMKEVMNKSLISISGFRKHVRNFLDVLKKLQDTCELRLKLEGYEKYISQRSSNSASWQFSEVVLGGSSQSLNIP